MSFSPSPRTRWVALAGALLIAATAGLAAGRSQATPTVSIADARAVEGAAGTKLRFRVTLSAAATSQVTVRYTARGRTAVAGKDFRQTSGVLVIPPPQRFAFVEIDVLSDRVREGRETLAVRLSAPTNAQLGRAVAVGTIVESGTAATAGDPVIAAAGDIACDPDGSAFRDGRGREGKCQQMATSELLMRGGYDAVLTLGDNQYPDGELDTFMRSFGPSWGRLKRIIRPVPGNHDYHLKDAKGYFDYFGKAAGERGKGWYSFDLGAWHLIALNSNCSDVSCDKGSEQERWLRADLAANRNKCVLAYWHHPRFSSGAVHGSSTKPAPLVETLYEFRADVILTGHDHTYERFGPTDPDGKLDLARGIRHFVVGTGGKSLYEFDAPLPTTEKRDGSTFGILELVLRPTGYDWRFVPVDGSFTDRGTDRCR